MKQDELTQLFKLLDTLPNPVTLNEAAVDDNGEAYDKIIYVNRSFIKHIGYSTEDIPTDRVWFNTAYQDSDYQTYISTQWFKAIDKAKDEGTDLTGFPAQVSCKDGQKRWFSITTQLNHPISDKYRTIVFLQTNSPKQDKIGLDKASLELMQKEVLMQTIIDTVPTRIFWKDKDGVYLGCNQAFLEDAQLEKVSDIVGKKDSEMFWKDMAETYRKDDMEVFNSGKSKLNYIETLPRIDGSNRVLSTSKVVLNNSANEAIGTLGTYLDISDEHEIKLKLKEQEKTMIIQSRQAAMGEMLSMIAHQWKQPLSTISAIIAISMLDKL
jgi:PAS domain-containing protein